MRSSWVALLLVLATAACKKESDPSTDSTPRDAAARDSLQVTDLDFNPGLPLKGGGAKAGQPAPAESSGASEAAPAQTTLKQRGADPKEPLRYAFVTGKPDLVTATFKTSMREEGSGMSEPGGAQPPVRLTLNVVGIEKKGEDTRFSLKVSNAEFLTKGMSVPPQAEQQLAAVAKAMLQVSATFRVGGTGVVQELEFASGGGAAARVTGEVLPLIQQALEMLFLTLPQEAVGIGAKWTTVTTAAEGGAPGSMTTTYTLVERSKTGALVHVDVERAVPAQALPDPRAPPGSTMEMKGTGTYDVQLRLGGPSQKATGDAQTRVFLKDASTQPPRSITTFLKVSQTLETRPGASGDARR